MFNRVVVAGGGGGHGTGFSGGFFHGGAGGLIGLPGGTAQNTLCNGLTNPQPPTTSYVLTGGLGGTQSGGGAGGMALVGPGDSGESGSFGLGGAGAYGGYGGGGGGGGGGYYGGGGGAGVGNFNIGDCYAGGGGGGGGGGSSFGPPGSAFGTGVNAGDGYVNLTPLSLPAAGSPPSGYPSSNCDGGQSVTDTNIEGVHVKLYTLQPSSQEVDVCFRTEYLPLGTGYGGKVVITPTVPGVSVGGVGVPSVGVPSEDTNSSACTTTSGNQVPGTHPVASGNVAGVPYMFDTYLNSSAAWVCAQVGTTVNVRVVVPITPPTVGTPTVTVTPGTDLTFYPDPGTP